MKFIYRHGFFLKLKSSRLRFCNKKIDFLVIFKWFLPLIHRHGTFFMIIIQKSFYISVASNFYFLFMHIFFTIQYSKLIVFHFKLSVFLATFFL